MNLPMNEVNQWDQLSLFGEDAYEIRLKIGLVPSSDHAQWQLEVWNRNTEELVSMVSRPALTYDDIDLERGQMMGRVFIELSDLLDSKPL